MTELAKCGNHYVTFMGDALSTLCDTFYVEYYVQVDLLTRDDTVGPAEWAKVVNE